MGRFVRVVNPNGIIGMVVEGSDADKAYKRAPSSENKVYNEWGVEIEDNAPVDTYDQAGTRVGDADTETPAKSASKSDWVAYAVSVGMPEDQANDLTRDELAAYYSDQS